MGESIQFIAIKKESFSEFPKGVQSFIKDFFEEETIWGVKCYVAVGGDYKAPWNECNDEDYREGLTQEEIDDCGIWTWFENNPKYVFQYHWS